MQLNPSIFEKDLRQLMASQSIAEIDYALLRAGLICLSQIYEFGEVSGIAMIDTSFSNQALEKYDPLGFTWGTADRKTRVAAYARSLEKCKKLYGNKRLSSEEMAAFRASTAGKEWRAILKESENINVDDPKAVVTVDKVMSTPLLGAIYSTTLNLDHAALEKMYGDKAPTGVFQEIVATMVMCRMGENCSPTSPVSEQLCWMNGICKPNLTADEAMLANLMERGFNTDALNAYVNAIYVRMLARDLTLFRRNN
ncbi:MAG: hypothetical protein HC782_05335 [Gammaproteobacteria bacterium]|nr:hypothetical protein [Gammaproteobacteria bacterium]